MNKLLMIFDILSSKKIIKNLQPCQRLTGQIYYTKITINYFNIQTGAKDPTKLPVPAVVVPAPEPCCNNTCHGHSSYGNPCGGHSSCGNGCGNNCCMAMSSISNVTDTNTVTITGGTGPMMAPVYNFNNVFNSDINFTQGDVTFNFAPVVNNR